MWKVAPLLLALLGIAVAGCGNSDDGGHPVGRAVDPAPVGGADSIRCRTGERPSYFVPGGDPALLIGCVKFAISGKRAEFSVDAERISERRYICLNPAFNGRRQKGIYQPSVCTPAGRPKLRILGALVPRQAVKGYGLIVWGMAPAEVHRVRLRALGEEARPPALFRVDRTLAARVGAKPFTVFVTELPRAAECDLLKVAVDGVKPGEVRFARRRPMGKRCR